MITANDTEIIEQVGTELVADMIKRTILSRFQPYTIRSLSSPNVTDMYYVLRQPDYK